MRISDGLLAVIVAMGVLAAVCLYYAVFVRPKKKDEEEKWMKRRGRLSSEDTAKEVEEALKKSGFKPVEDFRTGQQQPQREPTGEEIDAEAEKINRRFGRGNGDTPIGF